MRECMARHVMMPSFLTMADVVRASQRFNRQRSRTVGEDDIDVYVQKQQQVRTV